VILGANYYFFVVKKSKPVRFYFVAWNTYLVFAVLYMFVVIDLIPFNLITKNFLLVGASFEIIFVFISVMDKINFLENEKEEARKDIISILEEQAAYIIKENELLEEKISKRTQLLEEKKHKIEHQNEALVAQNNEIENQRKLIEKQHTQLGEYALNLESLIEERTLHLSQANIQLANKNDFLEQFAYITAHNLRAPVASILGLLNLAKIDSNSQVHLNDILSRLLASTSKLNALIKDLAIFLNNAQHSVLHFEDIPIEETINNIIHLLNIDINDANATIHYNQKTISTHIHSVNTYITSIFYNLIINSLKYRDHNKPLIINIVIEENSKEFKFIIEDNGLGFDFQNTDELFQFKNNITNPSLSNLGLGLYIVKKQIDALNGTVKVASKPNEGCKFEITIPKI
jgi:signal transduction histidine kinase